MRDRRSPSPRMDFLLKQLFHRLHRALLTSVPQPKRNTGYQVALVVLTLLVVVLGSLEVLQLATHTPVSTIPLGLRDRIKQYHTNPAWTPLKTAPKTLTPGTIKENGMLTCSGCDDPVLTTINSITVDTTNLRIIWTITLKNQSGAQQTDYFAEFSLQDPLGNTYEGTGNLNTDFFLSAGQTVLQNRDLLVSAASGCLLHTRSPLWHFRNHL